MNGNKTLSNKLGITLTGKWELPTVGTPGTIQNMDSGDNGYLSTKGEIVAWSTVEEVALDANDGGQQWERSADDDSGYFTLRNQMSGKFLHAVGDPIYHSFVYLKIEGTATFFV